jgi:hypothetical protein
MAAVIANTTKGNATQTSGALNISVARASGEGLLLGIQFGYQWGAANTISSAVWDSAGDNQSLTHVLTNQQYTENRHVAVYYLAAPTSVKTGNISVSFSGSDNDISAYIVRHITGHNTSAMISGSTQRDESDAVANDLPITISSATGELVIAFCGIRDVIETVNAGDFDDYQEQTSSLSAISLISGSKAGASSVTGTFEYTNVTSYDNALIAVSIAPAAAGSPPDAPTIGTTTSITHSSASVNWTDNSDDETGFKVEYAVSPYSSWTAASASPAAADAETLSVTGLSASTTYKARVAATNASGDSAWQETAEFSTTAAPVTGIRLQLHDGATEQASLTGITVAWFDDDDPATMGAPSYQSSTETTDADGWIEVDLTGETALDIGDPGFLIVYKAGATAADDIVFAGRIVTEDIA